MTEYIKTIDDLELDITIAIADYHETGDHKYIIKAHELTNELDAERRAHYNN